VSNVESQMFHQTFQLPSSGRVFAETLVNSQHSTRLHPERRSYMQNNRFGRINTGNELLS
jgi:hypothetical protein